MLDLAQKMQAYLHIQCNLVRIQIKIRIQWIEMWFREETVVPLPSDVLRRLCLKGSVRIQCLTERTEEKKTDLPYVILCYFFSCIHK